MSDRTLDMLEKRLARNLKKQVQNNLADVFGYASCKAVAREIKAGRNVTKNAEWGVEHCIHQKTAPRVDPSTLEFTPQSRKAKKLDEQFIEKTNLMLETGGFRRMNPNLLSNMRKKDKAFERDISERRRKRRR